MLFRSLDPSEGITCVSIPVEELRWLACVVEHVHGGKALTDVADLVILRGAGVQGPAQEQLSHKAAQVAHVDGLAEGELGNIWTEDRCCRSPCSRDSPILMSDLLILKLGTRGKMQILVIKF